MLMVDNYMSDQISALAPHKNMLDPNNPRALTDVASIPKPVASTISNFLATPRVISSDPAKRAFLEALAT